MSIKASRTVVGMAVIAILIAIFWYLKKDAGTVTITSYDDCVQAGYRILPTTPPECTTSDGRVFISTESSTSVTATTTATTTVTGTPGIESYPTDNSDRIRVTNITVNQKITSPLTITGQARGNWYFEASFPVELLDGNGKRLVQEPAKAGGDWMTNDFVPFSVTLTFNKPATATGTLILHNDNPSGLPANARYISIPVTF